MFVAIRVVAKVRKNYTKYQSINDKSELEYDSVILLTDAIKRAGSIERTNIRNSLAKILNFNAVTGKISFDVHGDPIKSAVIMKISKNLKTQEFY